MAKPGLAGGPHRRRKGSEMAPVEREIKVLRKLAEKATGDHKARLERRIKQLEDWLKVLCYNADKEEGNTPPDAPPTVVGCPVAQTRSSSDRIGLADQVTVRDSWSTLPRNLSGETRKGVFAIAEALPMSCVLAIGSSVEPSLEL